jgi:hypothetical protein
MSRPPALPGAETAGASNVLEPSLMWPVDIVEIIGPSEQGMSRPYLCRGDDGLLYYVKGRQTNRASLWSEWIAGHAGRALGLPIPPFRVVNIDATLLPEAPPELQDIGSGPAFGSEKYHSALWLEPAQLPAVPRDIQQDLVLFDWWIRNTDRTTGNTNLLWDPDAKRPVVIDHNNAFDPDFDETTFCDHHVFADQWRAMRSDWVTHTSALDRLRAVMPVVHAACKMAPAEWAWENAEMDVPARFDLARAVAQLARCENPELWRPK